MHSRWILPLLLALAAPARGEEGDRKQIDGAFLHFEREASVDQVVLAQLVKDLAPTPAQTAELLAILTEFEEWLRRNATVERSGFKVAGQIRTRIRDAILEGRDAKDLIDEVESHESEYWERNQWSHSKSVDRVMSVLDRRQLALVETFEVVATRSVLLGEEVDEDEDDLDTRTRIQRTLLNLNMIPVLRRWLELHPSPGPPSGDEVHGPDGRR